MTDQHNPAASDAPDCVLCDKRPQPEDSRVCHPCRAGLAADLDAISDLASLLPAAVAPNLTQAIGRGARARETVLMGGEALNLTAGSNPEVRLRFIPLVHIVPEEVTVAVNGKAVTVLVRQREHMLDAAGRPVLVPDGDQHGDLDPWVVVAGWVADWCELRGVGERGVGGPRWLRERLDWACLDHPDIIGWADGLRHLVGGMRSILAVKSRVIRYANRCPACDNAGTLYRIIDPMLSADDPKTKYVNCGACPNLFEIDDERITDDRAAA